MSSTFLEMVISKVPNNSYLFQLTRLLLNKEEAYMEKSTPIFAPQILKHVTQDKSYSWSNKHGQIRIIVSYRSSMNYLTASHV